MIDTRITTFLKLCELMNYRKTAEELNMTQPAVTQHIHFLENEYGCKLFSYCDRKLSKTEECFKLEQHARSMLYNESSFRKTISPSHITKIAIGATKTIGDYTIENKIIELLKNEEIELLLDIDNTENLINKLNSLELDILLVEGYFDKGKYNYQLICEEELIGICSPDHAFAGRSISVEELFQERIILREEGSGTRAVFESFLKEHCFSLDSFKKKSTISSFKLIQKAVEENCGISFVYQSVAEKCRDLCTFRIKDTVIKHEFNYVFLKDTSAFLLLDLLK